MIRFLFRLVLLVLLLYAIGYAVFAMLLPRPAGEERTDAIVVLTGGSGRLDRGFELMQRGLARRMLISGVARDGAAAGADRRIIMSIRACSPAASTLGREAFDTRSNADEVARWLERRHFRSIRLVTNDLHMPRARYEIRKRIGGDVTIVADAVPTNPDVRQIFVEYNKYLLGRAADLDRHLRSAHGGRCAPSSSRWSSTAGRCSAVLLAFPISLFGTKAIRGWCACLGRASTAGARATSSASAPGSRARRPRARLLVAVKHQSMYETLEIVLMLDEPAMVLKRELADIPLWGWVVRRYGVIPVDRSAGAAALRRMMRAGEAAIAEGRPIVIFPEGTRVPPGARPPLQPGFAGLYRALKLPVVPVAVDSGRLGAARQLRQAAGNRHLPLRRADPAGPQARTRSRPRVHEAINALEPAR